MKWLASLVLMAVSLACSLPAGAEPASRAGVLGDEASSLDYRGFEAPAARATAPNPIDAAAAPAEPQPDDPATQRQVIYTALLRLVVVSTREAHATIAGLAKQAGGYMQESDARSITIRVPADAFEGVLAKVSALGEVVDSNIRASDVTEEMIDLDIRLENAKKARERLLEHLAKSQKIEDTLKIEIELTRVSGEIEQIEGRLRYMRSQVSMSTIKVELNTNEPQRSGEGLDLPFDWIGRLGDGLVAGNVKSMPRKPQFLASGPSFKPPADFVRYYSSRLLVEAMDAGGVRIKVQVQDNYDEGALGFWSALAQKSLVHSRSLVVTESMELGDGRALIRGTRAVGSQTFGYLLVLVRSKRKVSTFEAWGPDAAFATLLPALVESAKSLERWN